MEGTVEIVRLDPRQKKKAADVVTAAFYDYPMFTGYFPDPEKRSRIMPWYLGNVLQCALHYGEVYTTPDISGVIFILPPSHPILSQSEYARHGFLLTPVMLGLTAYARSQACEKYVEDTRERIMNKRPHYYLWGLVVEPSHHRSGIGTALLKPLIERADKEGVPVYLETHKEANVAYYERFGFSLVQTDTIPTYGLDFWCMVREPVIK
jgi:hypothetical protein